MKSAESLQGAQRAAPFSVKDTMGNAAGPLLSMIGLIAVLLSTINFGSFIGVLPALTLSIIALVSLYVIIRTIRIKR